MKHMSRCPIRLMASVQAASSWSRSLRGKYGTLRYVTGQYYATISMYVTQMDGELLQTHLIKSELNEWLGPFGAR